MKNLKTFCGLIVFIATVYSCSAQVNFRLSAVPSIVSNLGTGSAMGLAFELDYWFPQKRYAIHTRYNNTWLIFKFIDRDLFNIERNAEVRAMQQVFGIRYRLINPDPEKTWQNYLYAGANFGGMYFSSNASYLNKIEDNKPEAWSNVGDGEAIFRIGIDAGYRIGKEKMGLDLNLSYVPLGLSDRNWNRIVF